jgi:hypothetical protein
MLTAFVDIALDSIKAQEIFPTSLGFVDDEGSPRRNGSPGDGRPKTLALARLYS